MLYLFNFSFKLWALFRLINRLLTVDPVSKRGTVHGALYLCSDIPFSCNAMINFAVVVCCSFIVKTDQDLNTDRFVVVFCCSYCNLILRVELLNMGWLISLIRLDVC